MSLLSKQTALITLVALGTWHAHGQTIIGANLLRDLSTGKQVSSLMTKRNLGQYLYRFPEELHCGTSYHNYIPYRKGLIAHIDGSGRLYFADSVRPAFTRMDSTCYEGYNFGAAVFSYKDTLFNLGGYGAWTLNGVLRFFNPVVKEWSAVPVNKRVELSEKVNAFSYFDATSGKLYIIYRKEKDAFLKDAPADSRVPYVQCLDLKTRDWWEMEQPLNRQVQLPRNSLMLSFEIHTPWGLLVESGEDTHGLVLLDFANNAIRVPDAAIQASITGGLTARPNLVYYVKDSVFTIYYPEKDSLVRIPLSIRNFSAPKAKLFTGTTQQAASGRYQVAGLLALALGTLAMAVWVLRKRKKTAPPTQVPAASLPDVSAAPHTQAPAREMAPLRESMFSANLTEPEKAVFELLLHNSLKPEPTTIDALNRALGVKQKDSLVQNKLRSDTLKAINQKFQVYAGTPDELVERERTEFDKRVFQYRINERYSKKIS